MKLQDYAKSDCTLLREPPVDISAVERALDAALVEAWRRGASASSALDEVLSDKNIVGTLAGQVSPHLEYQRRFMMEQLERELAAKRQEYETWKKDQVEAVDAQLGREAEKKREEALKARAELTKQYEGYTSAHQRLEQLRQRVKDKLKQLGGKGAFKQLMKISEAVAAADSYGSSEREIIYEQRSATRLEEIEETLDATLSGKTPDPLKDKNSAVEGIDELLEGKKTEPSKPKDGIFRKMWRILNYRIW